MKNYVLENDPTIDGIPDKLKGILRSRFTENREYWLSFTDRYRKDYKLALIMLTSINTGSNVIGQTNFHDEDQIEKFIDIMKLLMDCGAKVNFYMVLEEEKFGTMEEAFGKYLSMDEAFVTPTGMDPCQYKIGMNMMLGTCLSYHSLYRMVSANPKEDTQITYENCLGTIDISTVL